MEKKWIILGIVVLAICIVLGINMFSPHPPMETSLEWEGAISDNQAINSSISLRLRNNETIGIENKTIVFNFTDSNNKSHIEEAVTDHYGVGTVDLDLPVGNYTMLASFSEEGYVNSTFRHSFEIYQMNETPSDPDGYEKYGYWGNAVTPWSSF